MSDLKHLACPACNAVNRVPESRLGQHPRCGKCRQPLFSGKPLDLNAGNFAAHVQRGDLPVLVDFWAEWCGPCKMMAPQFAQAAQLLEPEARLAKLDTEAEPQLAAQFNIRSIPTLILFRGGREVARHSGAMGAQDIERWFRQQ
jgi:thioredoxin 2